MDYLLYDPTQDAEYKICKYIKQLLIADVPDKFHGKIWLLVDKYCYSAAEALACFCREKGFATLVGTQTGGSAKGAQPYFMALPYSGLLVEYEIYLTFSTDGTCNGISGTVPDIVTEEGRNALETRLMAIDGKLNYWCERSYVMELGVMPRFTGSLIECYSGSGDICRFTCNCYDGRNCDCNGYYSQCSYNGTHSNCPCLGVHAPPCPGLHYWLSCTLRDERK